MAFFKLTDIKEKEFAPGFFGKFIHGDKMTTAHWQIKAGSIGPVHQHIHEQIAMVISGEMEFTLNGEVKILKAGESVTIPSNVPHGAKALTDCYLIDVFQPVREDYK